MPMDCQEFGLSYHEIIIFIKYLSKRFRVQTPVYYSSLLRTFVNCGHNTYPRSKSSAYNSFIKAKRVSLKYAQNKVAYFL